MNVPLVTTGIVFLAAAAIGGGLKATGYEVKPITSVGARVGLSMMGSLALMLGIFAGSIGTNPKRPSPHRPPQLPRTPAPPLRRAPQQPWPRLPRRRQHPRSRRRRRACPGAARSPSTNTPTYARPTSATSTAHYPEPVRTTVTSAQATSRAAPPSTPTATWWRPGVRTRSRSGPESPLEQCREAAVASGSETIEMHQGGYACVRTSQGRTVLLKITKLIGDQSLQATATVWDDAEL